MKKILLIIIVLYFSYSCKENNGINLVIPENLPSWQKDHIFGNQKTTLMNCHEADGILYVMGLYYYSKISYNGPLPNNSFDNNTAHYSLKFDYNCDLKYPITDKYFIGFDANDHHAVIATNAAPHNYSACETFSMKEIDSLYYNIYPYKYWDGECISVLDQDYFLIPYEFIQENIIHITPRFLLAKLNLRNVYWETKIDIIFLKKIILDNPDGFSYGAIYYMKACKEDFLVAIGNKTYKIDTTGNVNQVYDKCITNIIPVDDILYGFCDFCDQNFLMSNDDGNTWTKIGYIDPIFSSITYDEICDSIVGYHNSQLFKFNFSNTSITSNELKNDGIEGCLITSIEDIGDSLVYITTMSGGFYKNRSDFFRKKNE